MDTTDNDNLVPITVRLEPVVSDAIAGKARDSGQEIADYMADILTDHVLPQVRKIDPGVAKRLTAEKEIKAKAICLARQYTKQQFDPHVTLKVFQKIDSDDALRPLYLRAIASQDGYERGNHIKARINRSLGAAIKTAVNADSKTVGGNRVKIQVSNALIFSYTELKPSSSRT